MALYRHRPHQVEAVEWNGRAFSEIPEWLAEALKLEPHVEGAVYAIGENAFHRNALRGMPVRPGWYLVKGPHGLRAEPPDMFLPSYEPVPPLTAVEAALLNGHAERIVQELLVERRRQVEVEGFSPKHDEAVGPVRLMQMAAAYLLVAAGWGGSRIREWLGTPIMKPADPRRHLVIAGALVIAALERLDRDDLAAGETEAA